MSRVIHTGIAAYGMSGKLFHAPFIEANPHFRLSAIVERHRAESREKYPESKLYRSFEELLDDNSIELVVVNTPVQTHFEYAKQALLAGKKVIVEKPFTVNASQAMKLDNLAKEQQLFLSVYQNRRYDGDFLALKNVIKEGLLGELKEAEFRYDRYRPELSGKKHKEDDLPGAGGLHDLGAHLIDQSIQLFGFPKAVFADILTMRKNTNANDYFELLLFYNEPVRVRLKSTLFSREPYPAFILQGEKGTFMQQRSDAQEEQLQANVKPTLKTWIKKTSSPDGILHTSVNGDVVRSEMYSEPGNYMNYYEDVFRALTDGQPNPVPASEAVLTMRIIDAAFQSSKEGRVVSL